MINLEKKTLDAYHNDLVEYINDENLDMLEEFTEQQIAFIVISLAIRLRIKGVVSRQMVSNTGNRYEVKVFNHPRFVTVSNDECTGVVDTAAYPYFEDDEEEGPLYGLKNLADMLNEAWYLCNN